jgi:hypothetical protein
MTIDAVVVDPRLIARIVHLAERCGCTYRSISANALASDRTHVRAEFLGPDEALRRLQAQIERLLAVDRTIVG